MNKKKLDELEDFTTKNSDLLTILQSSGKSRHVGDFPILQIYLDDTGGLRPFVKDYTSVAINHVDFLNEFLKLSIDTISMGEIYDGETIAPRIDYGFYKLAKGYFAEVIVERHGIDIYSSNIRELLQKLSKSENIALVSSLTIYAPPLNSSLKNEELESAIHSLVLKHKLDKNTTTPYIAMICSEDGEYYVKDFYIRKNYEVVNPDLHYGKGFLDFHQKLVNRLKDDSKGLILFHGEPGTGKTFYIRSLIKELIATGKYIIYIPPGMVDYMVDPTMMNFLSSVVLEKAEDGKSCILLLEDAEPLLASRNGENRSGGITNLLNVTDGLLNDMLSIQVIATFNTELANIDKALLRPERLLARKEFKKLRKDDAIELAKTLSKDIKITEDCTLAEIYAQGKNNEILVHEYAETGNRKPIGFR